MVHLVERRLGPGGLGGAGTLGHGGWAVKEGIHSGWRISEKKRERERVVKGHVAVYVGGIVGWGEIGWRDGRCTTLCDWIRASSWKSFIQKLEVGI